MQFVLGRPKYADPFYQELSFLVNIVGSAASDRPEKDFDKRSLTYQRRDISEGERNLLKITLLIGFSLVCFELKNFTFFTIFIQLVS